MPMLHYYEDIADVSCTSCSVYCCECVDTSTVSAGDLENIIEMETPPQSPAVFSSETQPLIAADHRRCSIIVGIDSEDVVCNAKLSERSDRAVDENTVLLSKSCASSEQVHSPMSSLPSSPRPESPLAFSVCPLRLGKTFAFGSVDSEARSATLATEAFIQRQQEQVGRIAEYNKRDSLIDEAQLAVGFILYYHHMHHRLCSEFCLVNVLCKQLKCVVAVVKYICIVVTYIGTIWKLTKLSILKQVQVVMSVVNVVL